MRSNAHDGAGRLADNWVGIDPPASDPFVQASANDQQVCTGRLCERADRLPRLTLQDVDSRHIRSGGGYELLQVFARQVCHLRLPVAAERNFKTGFERGHGMDDVEL